MRMIGIGKGRRPQREKKKMSHVERKKKQKNEGNERQNEEKKEESGKEGEKNNHAVKKLGKHLSINERENNSL